MRLVSFMLGRIAPQFRTLAEWGVVYDTIITARPLARKTLSGRKTNLRHLLEQFGHRRIGSIRPHEIAAWMQQLRARTPTTARRVLIETCEVFDEAVLNGWIVRNPASSLRQCPVKVARCRLTFAQWQQLYAQSITLRQRWIRPMLVLALVTGQRRGDLVKMRFDDIRSRKMADGRMMDCLHVVQQKTGRRLALPVELRLDVIGMSIADVITQCRDCAPTDEFLLSKSNGCPLGEAALTTRFAELFRTVHGPWPADIGDPPSLHECRSLSERLYRAQGIDTRVLLGHRRQSMTDAYNDDRGLSDADGEYWTLNL